MSKSSFSRLIQKLSEVIGFSHPLPAGTESDLMCSSGSKTGRFESYFSHDNRSACIREAVDTVVKKISSQVCEMEWIMKDCSNEELQESKRKSKLLDK